MMKMLEQLKKDMSTHKIQDKEAQSFVRLLDDIDDLGKKSASLLDLVLRLDQSAFFKPLITLFKR